MISSGSKLRSRLRGCQRGKTSSPRTGGCLPGRGLDVQDGRVGGLGWRPSDQNTSRLVVIAQLKRRLQRDEDTMLDLVPEKLSDNRILGGKRFLNRPVTLVHLAGCNDGSRAIRDPKARYRKASRPGAEGSMRWRGGRRGARREAGRRGGQGDQGAVVRLLRDCCKSGEVRERAGKSKK